MKLLQTDTVDPNVVVQTISEQPYQIDILKVFTDKIYVASAEKQISIYDLITFGQVYGDKKMQASETILSLEFYGDKAYVGEKN